MSSSSTSSSRPEPAPEPIGLDDGHRPRTQADVAERGLREMLVTLAIRPGEPLREARLMEQLGVGRTPLREACNRLAIDGLVVIHPRRGTFASDINIADLSLLTDLRVQLEGLAAERAAARATADERDHLLALVEESTVGAEPVAAMQHDHRIHRALWAAAHNPFLARTAARHHSLSTRIWYLFVDRMADVPDHVDELGQLVAQVIDGDTEAARASAIAHVRRFESAVTDLW